MDQAYEFLSDIYTWMAGAFAVVFAWFTHVKQKHAELTKDWDPKVRTIVTIIVCVAAFLAFVTAINAVTS